MALLALLALAVAATDAAHAATCGPVGAKATWSVDRDGGKWDVVVRITNLGNSTINVVNEGLLWPGGTMTITYHGVDPSKSYTATIYYEGDGCRGVAVVRLDPLPWWRRLVVDERTVWDLLVFGPLIVMLGALVSEAWRRP